MSNRSNRSNESDRSNGDIQIQVNGESRQVDRQTTMAQLLEAMGLDNRQLAVECNLQLVPRGEHASKRMTEGDQLEIVTLVGGG
jgi:sulfur carrier protein